MTHDPERWRRIERLFDDLVDRLQRNPRLRDRTGRMLAGDLDSPDLELPDAEEARDEEDEGEGEASEPEGGAAG